MSSEEVDLTDGSAFILQGIDANQSINDCTGRVLASFLMLIILLGHIEICLN